MAEAVLVALELHDDLPRAGIGITATEIGLPRRTLQHALQNEGVSYRDIVLERRMRRAGQLLSTTGKTLAEVAMRAGYSNPSNFHRAFLSLTGMTPRRFRERSGPGRGLRAIASGASLRQDQILEWRRSLARVRHRIGDQSAKCLNSTSSGAKATARPPDQPSSRRCAPRREPREASRRSALLQLLR